MLVGVHDWRDTVQEILTGYMGLALWNSLIEALPEPVPSGSRTYLFLYKFVNAVGVNLGKLRK